ncbi:MAG: [FeFe] hydrogenase H-cluster radical SAM maturase HydE [Pirellulales bacterium]|nr:[FeFe] hydrogenase H-cluster radical SAM maturase HydE [Pirellulales bacterium]
MTHDEILSWLRQTDPARLARLWREADAVRQEHVGGDVHLRGLIEFSNRCVRLCGYCGLRAANTKVERYRMSADEIMQCARLAVRLGYGTVVLQSGEDPGVTRDWMAELVRRIKGETPLAVTLSLGERDEADLAAWRAAGADRYLLRFETSNRALYDRIHPPRDGQTSDRLTLLGVLRRLGYEVGSGVMIGIPGQSYDDLARDIELFAALDLDMIGVGPYLAHPDTPLADPRDMPLLLPDDEQVPASEEMTYKVIALARLACPRANIPATTALATLNGTDGRELGLERGANVIMPNVTPPQYRVHYEIYPNKACLAETAETCGRCVAARIEAIGRAVGVGPGPSPNYLKDSR